MAFKLIIFFPGHFQAFLWISCSCRAWPNTTILKAQKHWNAQGSPTRQEALRLLTRLQKSLWKVPLPSALARVCHLPLVQLWWPQPNLDALIPRAVNGWYQKGARLLSPSASLCYLWQPLEAGKRPVSFPLSSSPATKYIHTRDINLRCQSLEICIANSRTWWHFTTGSRTWGILLRES